MQVFKYPDKSTWAELVRRPAKDQAILEKTVSKILDRVKEKGDKAIRKFTKEFDGVKLKKSQVSLEEIANAKMNLPEDLKAAIRQAKSNIETFHAAQKREFRKIETMPGVTCWRNEVAIQSIGCYIPGGSAALFSTVLMVGVPAQIAGCPEVVLCTSPSPSGIHPAILYAAEICGIEKIFAIGGAQAIAAMAYGTETVPRVSKIFGPGNAYVTLAKQLVQKDQVAIDIPAGASEVLVIADDSANPAFVAADLLSQAEHGPDSQVILVTTSESIAEEVILETGKQLDDLPRQEIIHQSLANSRLILVHNLEEAIQFSNRYAPEHLILACEHAEEILPGVTAAGSVFIGHYSPEAAGDYASGTNHILPTHGFAAAYSGVSLDSFVRMITYQQLTKEGLENIGPTVETMAAAEGLTAHKRAIAVRRQFKNG